MFLSLLNMFNKIKENQQIPDFFQNMSITSLYKNKGIKSSFSNQRGIFNVPKIKSIMDKLLYDDVYPAIDKKLSNSNIGGRKGRNIRDHLFVIYGVINDVINGASPPIDIQSIDIHKCFDEMWYQETHNDMFDANVKKDKFAIIAKMDEIARVVVKTLCGVTDEFTLEKLSVFGPIKSTITIDTLGQDCENCNKGLFRYKNLLFLPPLALIDEILENIDLMLIRNLLKGHSKTAKEAFYLETGLIPIRFIVMKRRVMYLHHILHRQESELIRKVYEVQKYVPTKNDWFGVVRT